MEAHSIENCCGVCEIGEFYSYSCMSPEEITERLKTVILNYCVDDYGYDFHVDSKKERYRTTNFFIATTSDEQTFMEAPLRALGFRAKKFESKHGPRPLLFWSRRGLPKEVRKKYKEFVREAEKEERF